MNKDNKDKQEKSEKQDNQKNNKRKHNKKSTGITVKKADNFSEWYTQVCLQQGANLVDLRYGVQGFVVHMPYAMKIIRRIYDLLDEELEKDGHEPFLFPTVIPKANLMKEQEHAGFVPDVYWVTTAGTEKLDKPLALRPTGETALYPMYSLWIRSYKDLPFKRYQTRITVYRNEKTTRPFLRGREFMFFESHDVFRTHKNALKQIKTDMKIMDKVVWKTLKLPFIFFKRPKWDKFLGAEDTFASDTLMPDGKRNQMSSTHDLAHNFAKPFNVKFKDNDGEDKYGWQTCFGPGIYRIMASLIGILGDDQGLILPTAVAPIHVVIIPIMFKGKEDLGKDILNYCKDIKKSLGKKLNVFIDDSLDESPGFKYNKYEMLGVPVRLEIGGREMNENKITLARRTSKEKVKVSLHDLKNEIKKQLKLVDNEIEAKSSEYFKDNTKEAETFDEVKKIIEEYRGFIKVPFCSIGFDGEKCADVLKAETFGGYVSGIKYKKPEKVKKGQKCVVCGKKAKHIVYVCKSY